MALVRCCISCPSNRCWSAVPDQAEIQCQLNTTGSAAHNKEWVLTGRIDSVDPHSIGELVLQVEETRIVESPGRIEHRDIQWRRATLDEA
jgi:hypothetical protein